VPTVRGDSSRAGERAGALRHLRAAGGGGRLRTGNAARGAGRHEGGASRGLGWAGGGSAFRPDYGGRQTMAVLVGPPASLGHQPGWRRGTARPLRADRHPPRTAQHQRAHPGAPPPGRRGRAGAPRALPGRQHPWRALRAAGGGGPPADGRRPGRPAGRDRGVPHRRAPGARARPDPGHGALHRHRLVHRARRGAGRPPMARPAADPRRPGAPPARASPRTRREDHGRRLSSHLRRAGTRHPLRLLNP